MRFYLLLPSFAMPSKLVFFSFPSQGHTADECEAVINEEIERIRNEPVSEAELQKAKSRARTDLVRSLASNSGLAGQLAYTHVLTGDWRNLFYMLDQINGITAEDLQRVAKQYLVKKQRTVAMIKTTDQ